MMRKNKLTKLIAQSIKKADTRYFWEDYTRQALAVQEALSMSDYIILPKKPSKAMMTAGMKVVVSGRTQVEGFTHKVYSATIDVAEEDKVNK
ncbi:MAG: hypothetical protein V4485_02495 [Pseudomonadota bacterium]